MVGHVQSTFELLGFSYYYDTRYDRLRSFILPFLAPQRYGSNSDNPNMPELSDSDKSWTIGKWATLPNSVDFYVTTVGLTVGPVLMYIRYLPYVPFISLGTGEVWHAVLKRHVFLALPPTIRLASGVHLSTIVSESTCASPHSSDLLLGRLQMSPSPRRDHRKSVKHLNQYQVLVVLWHGTWSTILEVRLIRLI
jgi:hypothetical protein